MRPLLHSLLPAVVLCTFHGPAFTQTLTDAEVDAAIAAGEQKKFKHLISDCVATPSFGDYMGSSFAGGIQRTGNFDVIVSLAQGRIAFAAAEGKRRYQPLSVETVTEDMKDGTRVYVTIQPYTPERSGNVYKVAATIEHLVLKSKRDPNVVLQPSHLELEPVEWANLIGGKVTGNAAWATFPLEGVRTMPPGDVDVVIITDAGERRCKVGSKDRDRLLGPRLGSSPPQ